MTFVRSAGDLAIRVQIFSRLQTKNLSSVSFGFSAKRGKLFFCPLEPKTFGMRASQRDLLETPANSTTRELHIP